MSVATSMLDRILFPGHILSPARERVFCEYGFVRYVQAKLLKRLRKIFPKEVQDQVILNLLDWELDETPFRLMPRDERKAEEKVFQAASNWIESQILLALEKARDSGIAYQDLNEDILHFQCRVRSHD